MKKEYFKNVEFLRFVFILAILFMHLVYISSVQLHDVNAFKVMKANVGYMRYCVEFFFIISGFFLVLTYKPNTTLEDFTKNKIIRLVPVILFTTILFFIFSLFKMVKFWAMDDIFCVFLINGINTVKHHSPFGGLGNTHSSWFVSVLFFVSLFYFYINKNFGSKILNLVAAIFGILGLYWLSFDVKTIFSHNITRGLTAIGIGIVLGQIYLYYKEPIRKFCANKLQTIIITLLEMGVFGYLIFGLCFKTKDRLEPTDLLFLFIVLFILFISKKGLFSKLLNNNLSVHLGKYVYSIFITHNLLHDIFKKYYFTHDFFDKYVADSGGGYLWYLMIPMIACVVFGIATYYFVERPSTNYLKKRFLK